MGIDEIAYNVPVEGIEREVCGVCKVSEREGGREESRSR